MAYRSAPTDWTTHAWVFEYCLLFFFRFIFVCSYNDFSSHLLLSSYVNQSPVPPTRSQNPPLYPGLNTSNANPFDDEDDDDDNNNNNTSSVAEKPTSNR
jgi:hypothetical protein